jgi:hypothetical protein
VFDLHREMGILTFIHPPRSPSGARNTQQTAASLVQPGGLVWDDGMLRGAGGGLYRLSSEFV